MRTWRRARAQVALATGIWLLVATVGCTQAESEPPSARKSPHPLATSFAGDLPPGLSGEPIRYLHGPGAQGPAILGDEMGVRIESLGDVFLISSNSEEKHALQRPADGTTLWQGEQRVDGFDTTRDGSPVIVLVTAEGDATTVVDDTGATVWTGTDPRDVFVGGVVVRRPEKWSADDPHGKFTVLDTEGEELWRFTFAPPDADDGDTDNGDTDEGEDAASTTDDDRLGVPVGARGDVLLLKNGEGVLQARNIGGEDAGDLLWSRAGDAPDLGRETAVPRPLPQIVGFYVVPEDLTDPEDAGAGDGATASDGERSGSNGAPGNGAGEGAKGPGPRETVLVRWSLPEAPSVLSLHDLSDGDVLWTRAEPGANPGDRDFNPGHVAGTVHDVTTDTLLLPQASGATPMIAIDLLSGEIKWEFTNGAERSISPAFAFDGHVYGDSRDSDGGTQVVLDAETKRTIAEGLDSYVETVTDDGYAIVVQGRQRFVFGPDDAGVDGSPPPAETPTARPDEQEDREG
ncbi:hypothetical protein CDO52_04220 [Nocardiopsis gilva YIM 90087]|uniref:Pyrrolo-quinoline quinone n=1 Tax=Nocardiopsis gilva YIM 90087 TaxID=1235441 RepID=A0A223S1T4_9ACTN|nr:hypothetical protein [Nocardiopsis gilva]ASU82092.1 hypothetical protein CDO52_04220 [Nocardiopsis gilva YIM 90087]